MRLLLDTHVWLWLIGPQDRLSSSALSALADAENELFLSAASGFEIALKAAIGKLRLAGPASVLVPSYLKRSGVRQLSINVEHALRAGELPMHHRDPFDRLLVAQAQMEDLVLVTADDQLRAYDVKLLAAGEEAAAEEG